MTFIACYLCSSSQGVMRDFAGIRIALCGGCNRYVVKASKVKARA